MAETEVESNDTIPFYKMTLEQLMNVNVSVVSDLPMNGRESPGIVTVITQEELLKFGVRDLAQALQLIPGFDFAVDVEGIVGIGVRGNWGNEGKVLMLWDGIEMNEELYSTLQFGGHYPVNQIKRIEIIRGPGSALYGGNAEYAVINITTVNNDVDGVLVDGNVSTYANSISADGFSAIIGRKWKDFKVSFSTNQAKMVRSNRDYRDNYGNDYSLANLSTINSEQYRADLAYHKTSVTAIYDNYTVLQRDGYDVVYSQAYRSQFLNAAFHAKSEFTLGKIKFTPGIKIKFEKPWNSEKGSIEDDFEPFNVSSKKDVLYLNYNFDPLTRINITGGFQAYRLIAIDRGENSTFTDNSKRFESYNYGGYVQALAKTKIVNFILGCRVVHNKYYGSSFVPRVGITKLWDKFHVKALYSVGYRSPAIENTNLNWSIKPEYTYVYEVEGGAKLGKHSYLTTNIYDITTKSPIVFSYDALSNMDRYENEGESGTRGFELDYKWKADTWMASINYSFYSTSGHVNSQNIDLVGLGNSNLAFPTHKFNIVSSWSFGPRLCISPTLSFYSKRFSVSNSSNENIISEHPATIYGNVNFSLSDFFTKGLTAQFGIFNFTDEDVLFIQPYNGNHAPLPGGGREYQIRFNYTIPFKAKQ